MHGLAARSDHSGRCTLSLQEWGEAPATICQLAGPNYLMQEGRLVGICREDKSLMELLAWTKAESWTSAQ